MCSIPGTPSEIRKAAHVERGEAAEPNHVAPLGEGMESGRLGPPPRGGDKEKEDQAKAVVRLARQGELQRALEKLGQQALADIDEEVWTKSWGAFAHHARLGPHGGGTPADGWPPGGIPRPCS